MRIVQLVGQEWRADMFICDICDEMGTKNCRRCNLGNPCLWCEDYDIDNDICTSDGACAQREE